MVLNAKLKELRIKKGLTQAQLGKLLDINPTVMRQRFIARTSTKR